MSLVKWVPRILRDDGMIAASEVAHYTHLNLTEYVKLTALAEIVEGLQKLVNEARGFEAMADSQSHGFTNRRILRERIDEAQRLLAQLEAHTKEG